MDAGSVVSADGPGDDSVVARIERELCVMVPVALRVAEDGGADRQATARHVIRVVMNTVRSRLPAEPD